MINKYIELLNSKKDGIIKDSIELINIPSITENKEECLRALEFVMDKMKKEGLKVSYTEKKDCGVVELGEGKETIGVLTHVDVVDVGDITKWETAPFKGEFDGSYIIGRGAMDDKCPTVIIMAVLNVLNSLDFKYKRKIQFIIGTSEEDKWTDMESYKKKYPTPDFGFSPDGGFPVHNIEKGYGDIEIEFKIKRESELGFIKKLESGDGCNTIPSHGILKIDKVKNKEGEVFSKNDLTKNIKISLKDEELSVESIGISCHSSLPQNGDNALTKLCRWIKDNNRVGNNLDKALNFILLMEKDFKGKRLGFDNSEKYYHGDFIGETFITPTILKLEEDRLFLNLNIRHKYGVKKEDIIKIFENLSKIYGFEYKIRESNFLDPLYVNSNNPIFDMMNSSYEKVTKMEGGFALAGGTSYAKALPNTVSWGPVFPKEADSCHQENEKMSIESIMKCTEVYGRFLYRVLVKE